MYNVFKSMFQHLSVLDSFLWACVGIPIILLCGSFFCFRARWFHIRRFKSITHFFFSTLKTKEPHHGVSPLKAFFASIAGCISIGNMVGVCAAINIGGPGSLFWMWIASILGMVVKYSEIYLGITYRVKNDLLDSYDGGPMYYLKKVDPSLFLSKAFCIALCIYGAEIYMFRVVTHTIVETWQWNHIAVVIGLLSLVLWTTKKGIESVGNISSIIIPVFLISFSSVSFWFFVKKSHLIIPTLKLIFKSAFTGHAAVGAFAGSSLIVTMSQGMKRACYSADIGVGCASVIMSEAEITSTVERQAAMAGIFSTFIDTFIVSTTSFLLVSISGLWSQGIHESRMVSTALSTYIPHMDFIWPIFIFLLGFSSIISYFSAGQKAAYFLGNQRGKSFYTLYATCAFLFCSFVGSEEHIMTIMSTCGIILLLINVYGIFRLRHMLSFDLSAHPSMDIVDRKQT